MPEVRANFQDCDRPELVRSVQDACGSDVAWPEVLQRVLALAGEELLFSVCAFWRMTPDGSAVVCQSVWCSPAENGDLEEFIVFTKNLAFPCGFGLPGRVWQRKETIVLERIDEDHKFVRSSVASGAHLSSAVGTPIIRDGKLIGVLECIDPAPDAASDHTLGCIEDIAAELAKACP